MNYGYKGAKDEDLIKNYTRVLRDNKIEITFLDGSTHEIPLSAENEQALLDKMLEQAKARSESSALKNAEQNRKNAMSSAFLKAITLMITGAFYNGVDSNAMKEFYGIFGGVTALAMTIQGVRVALTSKEIKELKKYDLYLSIKGRLEEKNKNNLFNGIEGHFEGLNINTLDNYSLKDIERIKEYLDKDEKWGDYFKERNKTKVLAKRSGR